MPHLSEVLGNDLPREIKQIFADDAARMAYVPGQRDVQRLFLVQSTSTLWTWTGSAWLSAKSSAGGAGGAGAPTVSITSPTNGFSWTVGQDVTIMGTFTGSNLTSDEVYNFGSTPAIAYGDSTLGSGTWSRTHRVTAAEILNGITLAAVFANENGIGVSQLVTGQVADTTAPVMTAFSVPHASNSRTITFTVAPAATDNVGVTGYMVTESSTAPLASDPGWTLPAPTGHTFSSDGVKTLYAWARDAAGNVSTSRSATVIVDTGSTAPTITAFVVPATSNTYRIAITTLTATDDVGPAYYLVVRRTGVSPVTPSPTDPRWLPTVPAAYTADQNGTITLDAYVMDANHNISAVATDTCNVTVTTSVHRLKWSGGWLVGGQQASNGDMVVRADTYGAWRRNAGASEWSQIVTATTMPEGFLNTWDQYTGQGAYEIVFDPQSASVLWMTFIDKVYRFNGTSWVDMGFPDAGRCEPNDQYRTNGQKIAVDPANSNVVLVGTQLGGLYITANGGTTWTHVSTVPSGSGGGITGICFGADVSGGRTQTIFCAAMGVGVYQSTDAGATWTRMTGSPVSVSWAIYAAGILWVSTGVALYQYASGLWTRLTPDTVDSVQASVCQSTTREIAIRGSGHLVVCTKSGQTWSSQGPGWNMHIAGPTDIPWLQYSVPDTSAMWLSIGMFFADVSVANRVWISAGVGVWYCDIPEPFTAGTERYEWHSYSAGIGQLVSTRILAPEVGHVLVGSEDRPVFWVRDNPDELPAYYGPVMDGRTRACWGLACNPNNVVAVVCNMNGGGYSSFSVDGGRSWTRFPSFPGGSDANGGCVAVVDRNTFVIVPGSFNLAYTLQAGTQLYVTHDGGTTWDTPTLPGVPASGQTGFGAVYFADWQGVCTDRVNLNTIYAYNWLEGLYRSTDGGDTWTLRSSGSFWGDPGFGMWNFRLEAVPANAGHLFAVPGPMGSEGDSHPYDLPMLRSTDGGATWTEVPILEAHCMGFGKHAPGETYPTIVVVGWYQGQYGIWRSTDNCVSFELVERWPDGIFDLVKDVSGDMLIYGRYYVGWSGTGACYIDTADAETVTTHSVVGESGDGGQINPGALRVVHGTDATVSLTPNSNPDFYLLTLDASRDDGATWTPVTVTNPPQTSHTITNVTSNCRVRSTWRVTNDVTPPTVPGNLVAAAASATEVDLSWDPSTDNVAVTGYEAQVSTDNNNWSAAGTTTTATTLAVQGLTASTLYYFRVRAHDAVPNNSAWSSVVQETTLPAGQTAVVATPTAAPAIQNIGYGAQTATFSSTAIGSRSRGGGRGGQRQRRDRLAHERHDRRSRSDDGGRRLHESVRLDLVSHGRERNHGRHRRHPYDGYVFAGRDPGHGALQRFAVGPDIDSNACARSSSRSANARRHHPSGRRYGHRPRGGFDIGPNLVEHHRRQPFLHRLGQQSDRGARPHDHRRRGHGQRYRLQLHRHGHRVGFVGSSMNPFTSKASIAALVADDPQLRLAIWRYWGVVQAPAGEVVTTDDGEPVTTNDGQIITL